MVNVWSGETYAVKTRFLAPNYSQCEAGGGGGGGGRGVGVGKIGHVATKLDWFVRIGSYCWLRVI